MREIYVFKIKRCYDRREKNKYLFIISISVARRKSLFDDKPEEIQQLTFIIKQDIASLNKQIAQLQNISKTQASRYGKHKQSHTNSVVVGLQVSNNALSNTWLLEYK